MNCKKIGIGLIVLSITLFFGITISEIFKLNEIPEIAVVDEKVLTLEEAVLKKCVPADPNLKYQFLGEGETKTVSVKVKNVEAFKKFIDSDEVDSETEQQLKKIEKESELHGASSQTLVFVERCRAEKESQ